MSTELAVLYGASTIFALFVVFSTIINWVRYRDSRYSPVSVSGNSAALDDVGDEADKVPYSLYRDPIKTASYADSGTPQEIVGGPYKLTDSNPSDRSPHANGSSTRLHLSFDEIDEEPVLSLDDTFVEVDENPTPNETDEVQGDLLGEDFETTESLLRPDVDSDEIEEQEIDESIQDNTLHFTRESKEPKAKASHTDSVGGPIFDSTPTLLKFCLITHENEETITGARVRMIMTKNGFQLSDGVFKKRVTADGAAILSVLPAKKPYRFDASTMSSYRNNRMLLGMTIYPNANSLNHFKSLLTLTNVLHKDFGAYLCDENGEAMNKGKLVNYIDILRSSFTTASETTEVQAAAMM